MLLFVSFGIIPISDLGFADYAAILAVTQERLSGALETLSAELKLLGLRMTQ